MLDDVERADHVVMRLRDALQLGQRRAQHRPAEPSLGDRPRPGIDFERIDPSELAEHRQIMPSAAANLENRRILRRTNRAADQRGEHLAARPVPPVPLVELRHLLVDDALHQRKTHCRLSVNVTAGVTNNIGKIGQAGPMPSGPVIRNTHRLLRPRLISETMTNLTAVLRSRSPWSRKLHRLCIQ
jgi:hypothetical protein